MASAEPDSDRPEPTEADPVAQGFVFISHSSEDAAPAAEICAYLESKGMNCWIAPRDISPGERISEAIDAAIAAASSVIVLVSEAANRSQYVCAEVELAFNYKRLIIPVRIENVSASSRYKLFLGGIHRIEAFEGKREAGIKKLYDTLSRYALPAASPRKPAEISNGISNPDSGITISRRNLVLAAGSLVIVGSSTLIWLSRDTSLSGSQRPLRPAWTKRIALAAPFGDPFAAVAVANGMALVAAQEFVADNEQLLALRLNTSGATTGKYLSAEPGSSGHAVLPAADGGAWVGGSGGSNSLLVRLDKDWKPLWSQNYGEGSITSILPRGNGVIAGVEGPESSGTAKLLFLRQDGTIERESTLLDRKGDSIQGVAPLPGGDLAALGWRILEKQSELWVARVSDRGREVWRKAHNGLGVANGWAIATVNDKIYVAGRTSPDGRDETYQAMIVCLDAKSGDLEWQRQLPGAPASARGLAASGSGGSARLYLAGWAGTSKTARLSQIGPAGDLEWDQQYPGKGATNMTGLALADDGGGYGLGLEAPNYETLHLTLTRFN